MEAANSTRSLPYFDYVPLLAATLPTGRCAYCLPIILRGNGRHLGRAGVVDPIQGIIIGMRLWRPGQATAPSKGRWPNPPLPPLPMRRTPGGPPGSKNKSRLPSLEGRPRAGGGLPRSAAPTVTVPEVLPAGDPRPGTSPRRPVPGKDFETWLG